MQGDISFYGEIVYQSVDEQRSRCSLCQRVIYKLLQKAHTTSHGTMQKAQMEDKPVNKAIKKFSLQLEAPVSEPMKKVLNGKNESLLNFEQILKNPVELPQKHRSESLSKNCVKKVKSNYSFYIKQSILCRNSLARVCFVYERGCYAQIVKGYRRWKKCLR